MPITPRTDVPADATTPQTGEADGIAKTAVTPNADGTATLGDPSATPAPKNLSDSGTAPSIAAPVSATVPPANEMKQPDPNKDADKNLTGTGTNNSPAEPVKTAVLPNGAVASEPVFAPDETSNATAVPPAPVVQPNAGAANPQNVSPSIASGPVTPGRDVPPSGPVATSGMASLGNPGENPKLADIKLADLPNITDPADIKALKDGDMFLASFICAPDSDKAWHASQIIDDLLAGRNIMGGLSASYWRWHYRNRPPIGQKVGNDYKMLD